MEAVYLCGASRSPIGRFGGTLQPLSPADLAVPVAKAAMARAGVDPQHIDEVIWGHGRQAGGGPNVARQVCVRAGVPTSATAYTLNKACGSSLFAVVQAARTIRLGEASVVLTGGVESMSNTPYYLLRARWGYRMGHETLVDGMYKDGFFCPLADQLMGRTAETLAEQHGISRLEQDSYALASQKKAGTAWAAGNFDDELVPIEVPGGKAPATLARDEHMRPETTEKEIARLKPVFKDDGTVHAGNSSGVTDGSAAIVVASERAVQERGLRPIARVVDWAEAGVDPEIMGIGPVPATRKLLAKTGLSVADIDLWELNEAFAAQAIACIRELGIDPERVNVQGGAIALGHPIGATGSRILTTLVHTMRRRQARRGVATLCISGGMGLSVLVERV